ncbi:MAG TPA: LLM class flavin-dependent oxidoreductase [Acidimicrobiia bacterium]|nr:LLM class flavin-dependent oxidoreductase [Acidimicrobiia bacterium]
MRFAVNLPNFGTFSDPQFMVDLSRIAEEAGWDGFFVWDHIVVGDGMPVADPWVLLGAVAGETERILIGTMVTPVPRRRPWVLARQATTVDHLSNGRLVLGVGIGFPPDIEFGTFDEPVEARRRADMLDEGLAVMQGIWRGKPFSFAGRHYRVAERIFAPEPVGAVPIWVAGMWPNRRPFRRAAAYDGVFPMAEDMHPLTPSEVAEIVVYVRRHRADDGPFDVTIGGPPLSPGELEEYRAAGVTWYQVGPDPRGESPEETRGWIAAGPPRS